MATAALSDTCFAIIKTYVVASGEVVTEGRAVQFAGADDQAQIANGAGEKSFGVALTSGTAGQQVQVGMLGHAIYRVKVGTGGATRGEFAILAADGYTNQTLGGGNTVRYISGMFLQTGVVGDMVGMMVGAFASGSA